MASEAERLIAKPKVVLDCMIFVQAMARPSGPAGSCFSLVHAKAIDLILSSSILEEWRDVMTRPSILGRFPGIDSDQVDRALVELSALSTVLDPPTATIAVERDPKDQKYLDLAIAANAFYLVTRDLDLLSLQSNLLQQVAPNLQILEPVEFLRSMARR